MSSVNIDRENHEYIVEYRSSYESDGWIYSGWTGDLTYEIIRTKDTLKETATNATDLETDWTNRTALTYT